MFVVGLFVFVIVCLIVWVCDLGVRFDLMVVFGVFIVCDWLG